MRYFEIIRQLTSLPSVMNGSVDAYTDVPTLAIDSVKRNADPDEKAVIDLLFCKEKMPILAVLMNCGGQDVNMAARFPGIPYIYLSPDSHEPLQPLAEKVQELYLNDPHPKTSAYTFRATSAEEILLPDKRAEGDNLPLFLQEKHMLDSTGAPTAYGLDLGLFRKERGSDVSYVVSTRQKFVFYNAVFWSPKDGLSLKDRLRSLREGLPSSRMYAVKVGEMLRTLFATPLSKLMVFSPEHADQMEELMRELGSLDTVTYYRAITQINEWQQRKTPQYYEKVEYAVANLAMGLYMYEPAAPKYTPQASLENRLSGHAIPKDDITRLMIMPVRHLCYGAATRIGSDYPNWLYDQRFSTYFGVATGDTPNTGGSVAELLNELMSDEDYSSDLFDLLVSQFLTNVPVKTETVY